MEWARRMKRRELLFSFFLAFAAFVAVAAFHDTPRIIKTIQLLQDVRGSKRSLEFSITPYVFAFFRIVFFYPLAALITGGLLSVASWLLTRPSRPSPERAGDKDADSNRANVRRRRIRYYAVYCALLAGFLAYIHLRMITLHPGLFRSSYRYTWFAGSSTWVFVVEQTGRIALVVLALALIFKWRREARQWLQRARRSRAVLIMIVLLFVAAVGLAGWKIRDNRRFFNRGPNIIFLGVESARPDHVSALGYGRPTTPHIDAFLQDAVRFDQAFVPLCRTYPSWISLLTGCNPPRTGVRCNLPSVSTYLPRVPTLAQHLKPLGYFTAFLHDTSFAWFEPSLGFDYISQPEHTALVFYLSFVQPATLLYYFFLNNRLGFLYDPGLRNNSAYPQIYRPEFFANDVVVHWRRMRQRERFLTAIHLCTIHVPYTVSYPYSTYFVPPTDPVLNRFSFGILAEEIARRKHVSETRPKDEIAQVLAQEIRLYDALLRSSDDSVGRILDGLKHAGLYDNSLIVLLSDHGENLYHSGLRYSYQCANHGNHLWGDEDQHNLLAIKFPQQKSAGAIVKRLVRLIDVAPTILDSLGLPPLEQSDGVSLLPYVEGRETDMHLIAYHETGLILDDFFVPNHLDYAFQDHFELHCIENGLIYKKEAFLPNLILAKDRAVRDERWKLIAYPVVGKGLEFQTELFDVIADPKNLNDLSTSQSEVVKRLRGYIWPFIENDLKEWGKGLPKELLETTETAVNTQGKTSK